MSAHRCEPPPVADWLYAEGGDAEWPCPVCGALWGPAYGSGSGDSSGWVRTDRCRHDGGYADCPPLCLLVHGDRFLTEPDLWHRPRPGTGYWEWRCLTCDWPVDRHPSWWARLKHRVRRR